MTTPGKMVVISGPSGSGKSTICKRLLEDPRIVFSVSATTRKQREGEVDGRDYHFLSRDEFRKRAERGEFIEHAEVYGNMYGTLRERVKYDHIVINDDLDRAVNEIRETIGLPSSDPRGPRPAPTQPSAHAAKKPSKGN